MAYTTLDRSYIRRYLGVGEIFKQAWPLIEQAISATQSSADGGNQPDSTGENAIKGLIYGTAAVTGFAGVTPGGVPASSAVYTQPSLRGLLQIEQAIATQDEILGALSVGKGMVTLDSYREIIRLRSEGRRLCHQLAIKLGMRRVVSDAFGTSADSDVGDEGEGIFKDSRYW
jgi:hypothetical protein